MPNTSRALPDGLVLRGATAQDTGALGDLMCVAFAEEARLLRGWAFDLTHGVHPLSTPAETVLIEEQRSGRIVATASLLRQAWTYLGVPFAVGQVETVAVHPDWRGHDLTRLVLDEIARLAELQSVRMLVIVGLPAFYRRFGYDYGLTFRTGRVLDPRAPRAVSSPGRTERFRLRAAEAGDASAVARVLAAGAQRSAVACPRDLKQWRYELAGHHPDCRNRHDIWLLETASGRTCGAAVTSLTKFPRDLGVVMFEVDGKTPWIDATASLIDDLAGQVCDRGLVFALGDRHPAYEAAPVRLQMSLPGKSLYVRIFDLAGLLRTLAPAFDQRLSCTAAARATGELRVSFYGGGLRLRLARGRLIGASVWNGQGGSPAHASMPAASFVQLLFGYRSLAELEVDSPDVECRDEWATAVLGALFPRQAAALWPLL